MRKHFLAGIGEAADTGAGIYVWPSVEAARSAHDDAWREGVKKRTGGYPTIRYFDLFLLIDNEHDKVDRVGRGRPRPRARNRLIVHSRPGQ